MAMILVAVRELETSEPIRAALSKEGWWVSVVGSPEAALRVAADHAPRLLLVDAELPGAKELLRALGTSGKPATGLLVGAGESVNDGAQVDFVVDKDLPGEELVRAVRAVLAAPRSRENGRQSGPVRRWTSQELFGEILEGLEREVELLGTTPEEALSEAEADAADPTGEAARPAVVEEESSAQVIEEELRAELPVPDDAEIAEATAASAPPEAPEPAAAPPEERSASTPPMGGQPVRQASLLEEPPAMRQEGDAVEAASLRQGPAPGAASGVPAEFEEDEAVSPEIDALAEALLSGTGAAVAAGEPQGEGGEATAEASGAMTGVEQGAEVVAEEEAEATEPATDEDRAYQTVAIPRVAKGEPPAAPEEAGDQVEPILRFGQYELEARLVCGPVAEVWRAQVRSYAGFRRPVAIKKLLPEPSGQAGFVDRFVEEAKRSAHLQHDGVVQIQDLGKIDGDYFIAMEFVEGPTLAEVLRAVGGQGEAMPLRLALFIGERVARALDYAHRRVDDKGESLGIVHGELSPHQVMLDAEGGVKVADFGIATVEAAGGDVDWRRGCYRAPERTETGAGSVAGDVFSLGAVLYELITGRQPFDGEDAETVAAAVSNADFEEPGSLLPELPKPINELVLRCLHPVAEQRFANVADLQRQLDLRLRELPTLPTPEELAEFLRQLPEPESEPEPEPESEPEPEAELEAEAEAPATPADSLLEAVGEEPAGAEPPVDEVSPAEVAPVDSQAPAARLPLRPEELLEPVDGGGAPGPPTPATEYEPPDRRWLIAVLAIIAVLAGIVVAILVSWSGGGESTTSEPSAAPAEAVEEVLAAPPEAAAQGAVTGEEAMAGETEAGSAEEAASGEESAAAEETPKEPAVDVEALVAEEIARQRREMARRVDEELTSKQQEGGEQGTEDSGSDEPPPGLRRPR